MAYDRNNPFPGKLKSRHRLTSAESDKNVQHLVFDIAGSEMTYKCGDSVAILPKNNIVEVAEILYLLKVQPDEKVILSHSDVELPIFFALYEHLCITNLSRKFFEWFVNFITDSDDAAYVEEKLLCSDEECHLVSKSHSLLELLKKFKSIDRIDIQDLVSHLRRLTPRLYSIASSPLCFPDEVHIVVSAVSYTNFIGHARRGIASTYLTDVMSVGHDTANIFIVNSIFSLPSDSCENLIMIGPGTGVAPFRGFLQERKFLQDKGKEIGKSWLFFGDRKHEHDFLFKEEFFKFQDCGVLTNFHLAFSRDQENKVYVQDRIWENREEIWSWILDGAYIYVCGDASRMAIDVDNILKRIAIEVGRLDTLASDNFFKDLRKSRRYQRDVY